MSLTLLQPLSAVSHGSVTVCFLPLLNQMGCVCCESQGQRNTERQRNEGHPLQASRAVCLVFLTILLQGCSTPSFFLTPMIKSLLPPTRKKRKEMHASSSCHSALCRTAVWAFQDIYYCTALLQQGWLLQLLSLALLPISLFPCLTSPHLSIPSPCLTHFDHLTLNITYSSLKGRQLPNLQQPEDF